MRDFFLQLLNKLDKLTGLKQMDKLMSMPNHKQEINDLFDILCRVSDQFGYIPKDDQQRIISENVITDPEFIGLNAKIVFKWLSAAKGPYLKTLEQTEPMPEGYKPLEGEDRAKAIQEWQDSLKSLETHVKPELGGTRLKSALEELPVLKGYKSPGLEDLRRAELHTQYVRENYEAITGKPKPDWIEENKWLELNS